MGGVVLSRAGRAKLFATNVQQIYQQVIGARQEPGSVGGGAGPVIAPHAASAIRNSAKNDNKPGVRTVRSSFGAGGVYIYVAHGH